MAVVVMVLVTDVEVVPTTHFFKSNDPALLNPYGHCAKHDFLSMDKYAFGPQDVHFFDPSE